MLNFHIIKVTLKNGEARYRTILTKSGKGIKTKTFRRKQRWSRMGQSSCFGFSSD